MKPQRLFHISPDPDIPTFYPRASPSHFEAIKGDVVFAITDRLLHNYLLPRDCPRVTYYATANTTAADKERFLSYSNATFIVAVEKAWYTAIKEAKLYCYELPGASFQSLDEGAGYYISYEPVTPVAVTRIDDVLAALLDRAVEVRFLPELWPLANAVAASTLQFSLIRMRNAQPGKSF